ncbi:uncharacterized protein QC763_509730 [Podospora pseudopauciseta]|uniref:Stress-response A/B barrel domain-containing protein n=1 Tax=Podospora pseudopauciseta TaxID=2093780 RepID=A0ABR0HAC4_9PEZI|nr:hypothetical protein QC763_509730 [Podospora pseudopauciseta]
MGVMHVVMFSFKPLATPEEVQEVCDKLLALKDTCLHPETNRPYMKNIIGGVNTHMSDAQDRVTHAFVSEFDSDEDREYYLKTDPAYAAFWEGAKGIVEKTEVVGFMPGKF